MKEEKHCRKEINGLSRSLIFRKVSLKESNSNVFTYTQMHSTPINMSMRLNGKVWAVLAPWVVRRQRQMYSTLMGWFCRLHCPLSLSAVGFEGIFSIIYSKNSLSYRRAAERGYLQLNSSQYGALWSRTPASVHFLQFQQQGSLFPLVASQPS